MKGVYMKKVIATDRAPKAVGPYSQGIETDTMVFTSGQLPINPETGNFVEGGIKEQTHQSMKNAMEVLKKGGSSLDKVVKATVYLDDINNFSDFNEEYQKYFESDFPARSCFEVANLPLNAMIEIEMIAVKN